MLKAAADALYKIWEHVSRQLETCEGNVEAYGLRGGFFTLPDEILATVLEYAALEGPRPKWDATFEDEAEKNIVSTVKSAAQLSHVCKRFRDLIIHSSRLWKCVFNGMGNSEMVSACLTRCSQGNGDVTLSAALFKTAFVDRRRNTSFINAILKRTENWGCFIHRGDAEKYPRFGKFEDDDDYAALAKKLDLPNLKQLDIRYPQAAASLKVRDARFHRAMHFYCSWSAPRLRSIFARNFIPIPFPGSGSLASLSISLQFDHGRRSRRLGIECDIVLVIPRRLPCTREVFVRLRCAKYAAIPPLAEHRIEMPCVTNLDLDFVSCYGAHPSIPFSTPSVSPHITTLQLRIRSNEGEENVDMTFNDIFSAVLPNAEVFPKLTDMMLDVETEGFRIKNKRKFIQGQISIPFTTLMKVRHLDLKTGSSEVNIIPDGIALPTIRTLTLRGCYRIQMSWLVLFLKQMKAQGDLDLLRVSVDEWCQSLNNYGVKGSLSKEDIQMLVG